MNDLLVASGVVGLFVAVLLVWRYQHRVPEWPERDAAWAIVDRETEPVEFV